MTNIEKYVLEHNLLYPFDQGLDVYFVTSTFQDHLDSTHDGRHLFPGTDYAVWYGHSIVASTDGSHDVYLENPSMGKDAVFGYDNHRYDYLHCSQVTTEPYKPINVKRGDEIGKSGNTGYVLPAPTPESPYAGTHVHVSLRIDGVFVDPHPYLEAMWKLKNGQLKPEEPETPTPPPSECEIKLLEAKESLAVKEVELRRVIRERDALRLSGIDLKADDLIVDIINESNMGILGKWSKFVDSKVKSGILKSILKYDIFVVIGMVASLPTLGPWIMEQGASEGLTVGILTVLGILVKLLLTRYDTNKDGQLNLQDTQVLKEYK